MTQLEVANTGAMIQTFSGDISGNGSLYRTSGNVGSGNGGTTILAGNNTYTGGTTIDEGTLLANNTTGSATGTGDVNVQGGKLGGTDLGSAVLAMGTKFTLINYAGTWNGGTFIGLPNYDTSLMIGANRLAIRYDDPAAGSNFTGDLLGGGRFVTITAVPEATSFITVGLGGLFAIAAVWMSKRIGVNVLKA